MNRKQFIESQGATCGNWTWSWSFINEAERIVIFGAWDMYDSGSQTLILSEEWETSRRGRRQPGYAQSREHIRLVEEEGYELKTFPMQYSAANEEDGTEPAKIEGFTPKLTAKTLLRIGSYWYASDNEVSSRLPEELNAEEALIEGASITVPVNTFERNPAARAKCIKHHGYKCAICSFDFEEFYGPVGRSYIHVHHIVPLSEIRELHNVDPSKDMVPICPNCHAIVHRTRPALGIAQLREHLERIRNRT